MPCGLLNRAPVPVPSTDPVAPGVPAIVVTRPPAVTFRIVWFPASVAHRSPARAPPPPATSAPPRPGGVAGGGGRPPCRRHLADDVISRVRHDKQAAPSRGRSDPRRAAEQRRLPRAFREPGGPRAGPPGRHHPPPRHRPAG